MMKNYIQVGDSITVTVAADVATGAGVLAGKMFGIASDSVTSGSDVTIVRKGVFVVNKISAQAWTVGAKVYWDDTAKEFTTVATSNTLIGCAVLAAANPSATGTVLLDGAIR